MVYEARKQSMAWTETDYSKDAHFRWKIKLRLEHLGALGIMGETAPLTSSLSSHPRSQGLFPTPPEKVLGTRMLSSPLSIVIVLCSLRVSIRTYIIVLPLVFRALLLPIFHVLLPLQLLQQRFLPTLISIFQAPQEKTPLGINAVSELTPWRANYRLWIQVHFQDLKLH